jgi:hypothetical protein
MDRPDRFPFEGDHSLSPRPGTNVGALPELLEVVTYIASAGISGIIGNRADAIMGKLGRPVGKGVRRLSRRLADRSSDSSDPYTSDEAAELAKAAVLKMIPPPAGEHTVDVAVASQELLADGARSLRVVRLHPVYGPRVFQVLVSSRSSSPTVYILSEERNEPGAR